MRMQQNRKNILSFMSTHSSCVFSFQFNDARRNSLAFPIANRMLSLRNASAAFSCKAAIASNNGLLSVAPMMDYTDRHFR